MSSKMIRLICCDGEAFEVEESAAVQSQTIKSLVESECLAGNGIPLPNVKSDIMPKVVEYLKKHDDGDGDGEDDSVELKKWDSEFINVDQAVLYDLIMAANYMEIKNLLDLACQRVADMIKGKTVEQIRQTFNIQNDFSPEEEEKLRNQNLWAFE